MPKGKMITQNAQTVIQYEGSLASYVNLILFDSFISHLHSLSLIHSLWFDRRFCHVLKFFSQWFFLHFLHVYDFYVNTRYCTAKRRPAHDSSSTAYRWCCHLANARETAPATTSGIAQTNWSKPKLSYRHTDPRRTCPWPLTFWPQSQCACHGLYQ